MSRRRDTQIATADPQTLHSTRLQVIEDLRELVIAIERRVPRLERTGEIGIAREAEALRSEALARLAQLERSGTS